MLLYANFQIKVQCFAWSDILLVYGFCCYCLLLLLSRFHCCCLWSNGYIQNAQTYEFPVEREWRGRPESHKWASLEFEYLFWQLTTKYSYTTKLIKKNRPHTRKKNAFNMLFFPFLFYRHFYVFWPSTFCFILQFLYCIFYLIFLRFHLFLFLFTFPIRFLLHILPH